MQPLWLCLLWSKLLEEHLKTHTGEKTNKCNQCDYSSSQAGNLRRHFKMHSGEKPNICNQCDFASSHTGNLGRHLKKHSGEKPNKCNQCYYASSRAGNLKAHLKTHSGEKPNKCDQCVYASSDASNMRRHLERHTGAKQMQFSWLYIFSVNPSVGKNWIKRMAGDLGSSLTSLKIVAGAKNYCQKLWKIFEQLQVCPHYFTLSKRGWRGVNSQIVCWENITRPDEARDTSLVIMMMK